MPYLFLENFGRQNKLDILRNKLHQLLINFTDTLSYFIIIESKLTWQVLLKMMFSKFYSDSVKIKSEFTKF